MLSREVEDGGENNIRNNDQKRRLDDGGRGGSTDSIGPAADAKPLQATERPRPRWVAKNMKIPPAKMPQTFEATVRQGTMISAAKYFGASTNSTGSKAMTRSASISSVTLMVPISAANAEPERPLTAIAVRRGPISRVNPTATRSIT